MKSKIKLQNLLREMTIKEESVNGLKVTQKAQKDSKKFNDEYNKEVSKKMKDYEEPVMPKEDKEIDDFNKPGNIEGEEKTYHDEMEIRNGQEMIDYDLPPDARFKERQEMALKGDSKMGNKTYEGKWNPETGEGNGNTEEVWGSSGGKHTGEEILKHAEASKKKRAKAERAIDARLGVSTRSDTKDSYLQENKNKTKDTMKRLRFKKPFDGLGNALNLIPETYKVNNKEFEMTDGNESYTMRWEGNLNEGKAVVLKAADQNMINEDMEHMKRLMGFNSNETLGRLKGHERINENKSFKEVWEMTQNLMNENFATNGGTMGFVDPDDDDEDEAFTKEFGGAGETGFELDESKEELDEITMSKDHAKKMKDKASKEKEEKDEDKD